MGKGFYNDKARIIAATILSLVLFAVVKHANASHQEFELFDRGYEYYLSYQPEKAVEAFRIFLKEFPNSSAKDVVMFWLGKSLIHLKSFREAEKVFSEIKHQFPDSPFIPHIDKELETISKAESEFNKTKMEISEAAKEKLAEVEKKAEMKEKDLAKAVEERDKLRAQIEEEKKNTEEMKARVAKLEGKNAEIKILLAKFEEQQRDWKKFDKYLKQLKDVNKKLDSEIQRITKEMTLIENERGELKDRVKRYESVTVRIKDKKYIASEVLKFMIDSSVVLNKLGIEGVLWRSGNICEDFVNEQILYDEAKKLNIIGDVKKHKDLVERYNFGREEGDYLYKYLTISDLIDRKVKEMPGERVVESLLLRYTQKDEYEKAVLATELRKDAKGGKSFEDVYKSHPDMVRLILIRFQELEGWIKDRIQLLEDGEISDVVKTENDYMILKPLVKKPSYESRDEVRIFIKRWMDELRKGEEIRIERTE